MWLSFFSYGTHLFESVFLDDDNMTGTRAIQCKNAGRMVSVIKLWKNFVFSIFRFFLLAFSLRRKEETIHEKIFFCLKEGQPEKQKQKEDMVLIRNKTHIAMIIVFFSWFPFSISEEKSLLVFERDTERFFLSLLLREVVGKENGMECVSELSEMSLRLVLDSISRIFLFPSGYFVNPWHSNYSSRLVFFLLIKHHHDHHHRRHQQGKNLNIPGWMDHNGKIFILKIMHYSITSVLRIRLFLLSKNTTTNNNIMS